MKKKKYHKHKLFNMRDVSRIIDAMSVEEAQANPARTRYIKDVLLLQLWPAVIRSFYPETYTLGDALKEAHLYDFFQSIWSDQWIVVLFDILERMGVDKAVLELIRDTLINQIKELFKIVLSF